MIGKLIEFSAGIVKINDRKGALPAKQFSRIVKINGRACSKPSSSAG